ITSCKLNKNISRITDTDPDDKWSNLHREREKNHLYKIVGTRSGGELIEVYEKEGQEGVLRFAAERLAPAMYNDGEKPQELTFAEFMKWKNLGKPEDANYQAEWEKKFVRHPVQYKLNKRGLDGETVIHLLLARGEPICTEIARILLKRYPGLAVDFYEGDEMFGQSALHLAIVHDECDIVQLLLECGADVNARACGEFFLPEDQKNGLRPTSNYQGYAYYGEYPLAFAACFGNKDIYDLLIQYGADPNMQDIFGNTILHMCVIRYSNSMYSYAVRHWRKPAHQNVTNYCGMTPLTLATKLGRKDIFEKMLDLMKVEFWRFGDITCSAYPLTALDTIRPDGSTNYESALMTVINGTTKEHLDMIGSEVIQRLIADKWKFFQWKLYQRLGHLILHTVFLCFVIYTRPTENSRICYQEMYWDDHVITFKKTAPAKVVFFCACICLILCVPCRLLKMVRIEEAFLVFALPGSWIFFLFFARVLKSTGPFVQMIYSMIAGDMVRFALIASIFLISFSQVFYFFGKDMSSKQKLDPSNPHNCPITGIEVYTYSSILETFITLFRATMSGYDYEEFGCSNYEPFSKILFVLFMFIMPVTMLNILIAMMGNTYTKVIVQAEKAWKQQYAQIVMVLERSFRKEELAEYQLKYSISLREEFESGIDVRGLMVYKQTEKTRAQQKRQALYNWKTIGRKVLNVVRVEGAEKASYILHSNDRILDEPSEILTKANSVPPTRDITVMHSLTCKISDNENEVEATLKQKPLKKFRQKNVVIHGIPNIPNMPSESDIPRRVPLVQIDMFIRQDSSGADTSSNANVNEDS
uniref:ANK_REP_REGION domain-containing protein n=1 Tax=Syphacia muris TaxID=451379 RepID=A0A0N5AXY8_9BILA